MLTKIDGHNKKMTNLKQRIMVADDDPAILDALKMMLEVWDYDVDTAADGKVVARIKHSRPQLLLLDIWMSGIDGRDICKKLKSRVETRDIPVILISASQDIAKSCRDSGANDYIAKPFEMNELLGKIEKYITN
jgi:CheY-like chemotaxis protein